MRLDESVLDDALDVHWIHSATGYSHNHLDLFCSFPSYFIFIHSILFYFIHFISFLDWSYFDLFGEPVRIRWDTLVFDDAFAIYRIHGATEYPHNDFFSYNFTIYLFQHFRFSFVSSI